MQLASLSTCHMEPIALGGYLVKSPHPSSLVSMCIVFVLHLLLVSLQLLCFGIIVAGCHVVRIFENNRTFLSWILTILFNSNISSRSRRCIYWHRASVPLQSTL